MNKTIAARPHFHLASAGLAAIVALGVASPALAAPGIGEEVYGATVEPGEIELEARFGQLAGGDADGENNFRLEAGYGVSGHLRVATVAEFERAPGDNSQLTHAGIEAVYHVARIGGVDIAAYGEYELGFHGESDGLEAKLLVERRARLWDLRLNLIAEKPLDSTEPVELGYAASADVAVASGTRLGVTAFGEMGGFRRFLPYAEHYLGPTAKFHIHPAHLKIETGYLFALGKAREETDGQWRLNLEFEL
jgi:hypothetical protein